MVRAILKLADGGAKKSVKALKNGVFELKIPIGPGYRVYYAQPSKDTVLILIGGDKKTQYKDIKRAKSYWSTYGQ